MKKGLVFDLDGTLVYSIEDIADSMNKVLEAHNLKTYDYETYKVFVGNGLRKLCERALGDAYQKGEKFEAIFEELMNTYADNCVNKSCLYPGISDLLTSLKDKGLKLAVLSNKANRLTQIVGASLLKEWKFDFILGEGGDIPRKPETKGVEHILSSLDLKKDEVLYIGDSGVDMQTAENANLFGIGVTWGFRSREELAENNAKAIVDKPEEILKYL